MLNAQKKLDGSTYNSSRVRGNHICESLANAGEISNSKSWFRFFRIKYQVQATYFGMYTYKIDSETLERIEIAMERTNNTQASQQHARTNQTTLHKQNTCKHNSSTADIASAAVSASAARICQHESQGKEEREEGRPRGNLRHDQRHSNSPIRSHTTQLTESITQNQSD